MSWHRESVHAQRLGAWKLAILLAGIGLFFWAAASETQSAEPLRESSSLKYVPADAAFFYSRLRLRQEYDAVVQSKAWARLLELPGVKAALEQWKIQSTGPNAGEFGAFLALMQQPENKELLDLLIDGASQEIFFSAGASTADLLGLFNKLSRAMNTIQAEALSSGNDSSEIMARRTIEVFSAEADSLKAPDLIIGFKITDAKRAETQLTRLERLLAAQLESQPALKARLGREAIGSSQFLTLKLDGSLIPWDQIKWDEPPTGVNKEQFDKLIEKIKKLTLTISIGVRDGYLLLSVGATNEHLRTLGQGPLLLDQQELAPLRKQGDKPFTSLAFVSQKFLAQANSLDVQLDNYVNLTEKLLPQSELDAALQKEIIADAKGLAADLKKAIPKPGAMLSFAFQTPRGAEGYAYDWGDHRGLDGTQKLTILDHVGGSPLAFFAGRTKYAPESYEVLAKWLKRAAYYGERLALSQFEPEQQALYQKLRTVLEPLATRLDQVVKTMWIPAFKDGQGAFVLDAKVTSPQWQQFLPRSAQPLPMLEIGLVYAVSDADLVKRASAEVFSITQEALKILHAATPQNIPEIELTPPQSKEFPAGTVYFYKLPTAWGLDPQLAPNAGLSKDVLALSLIPKFSLRLLEKSPLPTTGPLAQRERPLATASHMNWAALVAAIGLWIDYGIDQSGPLLAPAGVTAGDPNSAKMIKDHVHAGLEFLQCLRSISSVSYFEDGALVTHSEWHMEDRK